MGKLMTEGMRHIVIRHISIKICLNRKWRVDAAKLLHGKNLGNQNLLRLRIKSGQAGKCFSRRLHGLHGFCPPRAAVLPVNLPPGLCGFIDQFHQITAQGIQFFYRVSAVFQTGVGRKGGGIVIDATVGGVQKQQRAGWMRTVIIWMKTTM